MKLKNLKALLKDVLNSRRFINLEDEIRIWIDPNNRMHIYIDHVDGSLEYISEDGKLKRVEVYKKTIGE